MAERRKIRKILFLSANPSDKVRLRLDEEIREIGSALSIAKYRDRFSLSQKWAVRSRDVRRAILEENPQIVHFSGHGEPDGHLVWEDSNGLSKLVEPSALAELFRLTADKVQCVLLNACYSEPQAEAIAQDIDYVIGMSHEISDEAAIEFAVGFYDALGSGKSIEEAYYFGLNAIQLQGIPEHLIPVLKVNRRRLKRWILVLTATIEDVDRSKAEAIIEHLRKLSQDASITLKETQPGSVRLIIESSENGFRRIQELIRTGQLTQVIGILIQEAREESLDTTEIHPKNMANMSKELRPRILVLDDDRDWLDRIEKILSRDYDLTSTETPEEAISELKTTQYSLAIIDLKLRMGISGLEVIREMRKSKPDLRAIILTGYADPDSAFESAKAGALAYVSKGAEIEILRKKVEEIIKVTPIRVFLSYVRADKQKVTGLYNKLVETGFLPWMDIKNILPGKKWQPEISRAIKESDFFVAFLSPNSIAKRGFIQKEIQQALEKQQELLDGDIYFIPVRLVECEIPEIFNDYQCVDIFKRDGFLKLSQALLYKR